MKRIADGRRSVVQVRLTREIKARITAAAAREHRTVSAWVRHLVRRELAAIDRIGESPARQR